MAAQGVAPRGGPSIDRDRGWLAGVAAAVYAAYFLLLFSQFPRAGRLPGNCDSWYAIAFTNLYLNEAKALLGGPASAPSCTR